MGVLLVEGGKVSDCAVVYEAEFVKSPQPSIISLLTIIVALHYILEINYPKCHVQAMGALGVIVLKDKYYKLGIRAIKMLRLFK